MRETVSLPLAAIFLLTATARAGAVEWFPVTGEDYQARSTLSVIGGVQDFEDGDSDSIIGLEYSLVCPSLALDSGTIRQQISVTRYDENGFEATSFELNPHYLVLEQGNLGIGIGPGLGYIDAEAGSESDGVFAVQAGASVHYRMGALFLGAETRYQWTQEADFGATQTSLDNWRAAAKVGFNF